MRKKRNQRKKEQKGKEIVLIFHQLISNTHRLRVAHSASLSYEWHLFSKKGPEVA